jgi:hypothetical protein
MLQEAKYYLQHLDTKIREENGLIMLEYSEPGKHLSMMIEPTLSRVVAYFLE